MASLLRSDVRWTDLGWARAPEQVGRRPVLVISDDLFNERSRTVIALAITSQVPRAGYLLTQERVSRDLPKRS